MRTKAVQPGMLFGDTFLADHAYSLLKHPDIAIVELIANAYDAGATRIDVTWPPDEGGVIAVEDNGTGMTAEELEYRWKCLSYNRKRVQGPDVVFPPGVSAAPRTAFGQSGKGRHAMFCFSKQYTIETWKDGECSLTQVSRKDAGDVPYDVGDIDITERSGHGTRLSAQTDNARMTLAMVKESVGSKFIVDPEFDIYINGQKLNLVDIRGCTFTRLPISSREEVTIALIRSPARNRTMRLHGVTWWVGNRMVGQPSWEGLDGRGNILDGRSTEAHTYSFIVTADLLKEEVTPDWTGFRPDSSLVSRVKKAVLDHVIAELTNLLVSAYVDKKRVAIDRNRDVLTPMPKMTQAVIGRFIDTVQQHCHRISADDLSHVVRVLANMESARSGYDLLRKLAACSPDDIDRWDEIMQEWDATRAEIVLSELGRRLEMIKQLESKAYDPTTKELHEIQPLFEGNLWIFGPEFESVDFRSNKAIVTILWDFFGVKDPERSLRRPDFIALPDETGTLGAYASPAYRGTEVRGIGKVLLVELKRGGFTLTDKELYQANGYAGEIRRKAGLTSDTAINAYVLGTKMSPNLAPDLHSGGNTHVWPMLFDTILKAANARTFYLLERIEETPVVRGFAPDPVLEGVLNQPLLFEPAETPESRN